jgi:hypothetical protein
VDLPAALRDHRPIPLINPVASLIVVGVLLCSPAFGVLGPISSYRIRLSAA